MTLEEQAGDGFIDVTALGLQSSVPAPELRGVRRCGSGERRGRRRCGTRPALNTFWPVSPRTRWPPHLSPRPGPSCTPTTLPCGTALPGLPC